MRCDKCWLRWPQANQDKNHRCSSNPTLHFYFISLSVPAYFEAGSIWEWKGSILIGLRWPCTGHLTFLLPKSFLTMPTSSFPEGWTPQGKHFVVRIYQILAHCTRKISPNAIIEYDLNRRCWRENSLRNYILEFCLKWKPIHGLWILRL